MTSDPAASAPLGRADFSARQLAAVVALIQAQTATPRVSLIAHSWGSMVAGAFAARCPWAIERLVFFGPVLQRQPSPAAAQAALPGWTRLTVEAQRQRFAADLPQGQPPTMPQFERWAAAYLASEPDGGDSVRIPTGPMADIAAAWRGSLAYDPALLAAPLCVLRGEWDSLCRDDDANWLLERLPASLRREDVKLARGTHLMHLETGRMRLYDAAHEFLSDGGTNGKLRRNRRNLRGAAA
jgi:pimeloyl-ACP methyl ester carboxylesterase